MSYARWRNADNLSFYLQYKNVKVDVSGWACYSVSKLTLQYLNAIWNVINFQEANKRYEAAQ